jgi:SAM-dependent MidA family methyltransferase
MNCGLLPLMDQASLSDRVNAQKLIMEHEMGELFKVIALGKGPVWEPVGFAQGDRTHTL